MCLPDQLRLRPPENLQKLFRLMQFSVTEQRVHRIVQRVFFLIRQPQIIHMHVLPEIIDDRPVHQRAVVREIGRGVEHAREFLLGHHSACVPDIPDDRILELLVLLPCGDIVTGDRIFIPELLFQDALQIIPVVHTVLQQFLVECPVKRIVHIGNLAVFLHVAADSVQKLFGQHALLRGNVDAPVAEHGDPVQKHGHGMVILRHRTIRSILFTCLLPEQPE